MDVVPAPMPPMFYPIPLGPVWAPYQIQAASWDALFPGEWNFDSNQQYTSLADPSVQASLVITGKLPVTAFSPTGAGGPVIGMISQSSTGGSLPASATLRVALCAIDANGLPTPPSQILIIGTSASGTDTFTLNNIQWPAVSGLSGYVLFAATQDDLICAQSSGTSTPSSITFRRADCALNVGAAVTLCFEDSDQGKTVRSLRHSGRARGQRDCAEPDHVHSAHRSTAAHLRTWSEEFSR